MDRIMKRVAAVVTGLALAITAAPGRATGTLLLDQENVIDTSGGSFSAFLIGTVSTATDNQVAQTFTVGIGGTLSRVDVQVEREGAEVPLVADLYPTVGGVPNPSASLAHWSIAPGSVPTSPPAFLSLDLGASAFAVLPGDVFAIALSAPGGLFANQYGWANDFGTYAGGAGYGRLLPSGTFALLRDDADLGFRTFVDVPARVPEPGTLLLLGFGLAELVGLALRCRTRERRTTRASSRRHAP
jgi:hypothetical protein